MNKQKNGLARYLSGMDAWALSMSCIIGWGAFVMPGTTFLPAAGPAGTAIAMAFSMLIIGVIGASYASLMSRHPGIGGVYAYAGEAFGRGHAFLSAWFLCLFCLALIPRTPPPWPSSAAPSSAPSWNGDPRTGSPDMTSACGRPSSPWAFSC